MATAKEDCITIIPFDGTKKQWRIWSMKFMARARRKGYKEILLGNETLLIEIQGTPLMADEKKIKNLNALAYEDIILSKDGSKATGRVAFRLMETSTSNMADGNAREAWEKLKGK